MLAGRCVRERHTIVGGGQVIGGGMYNPICIAGPQMNKKIMRKLISMTPLTDEQVSYLHHDGAVEPHARIRDMDLMGIDQVLVIPSMVIMNLPFAENVEGVDVFCQAYNNWCVDWCSEVPEPAVRRRAASVAESRTNGAGTASCRRTGNARRPDPSDRRARCVSRTTSRPPRCLARQSRPRVPRVRRDRCGARGAHVSGHGAGSHRRDRACSSLPGSCSTRPEPTRRPCRSSTRCRTGWRRFC